MPQSHKNHLVSYVGTQCQGAVWGFQIKSLMETILGDAPILKVPFCPIKT